MVPIRACDGYGQNVVKMLPTWGQLQYIRHCTYTLYRVWCSALGQRIVHCLVVSNFWIHHHWESGELIQGQYTDAMDTCKYVRKAFVNDTLPVPGSIFPVPFYPNNSNIPPLYSSSNFLALFVNTIFHYMSL